MEIINDILIFPSYSPFTPQWECSRDVPWTVQLQCVQTKESKDHFGQNNDN